MAHAGNNIYAETPTAALLETTGEIEIRVGCLYIRMNAAEAAALIEQLHDSVKAAVAVNAQPALGES